MRQLCDGLKKENSREKSKCSWLRTVRRFGLFGYNETKYGKNDRGHG